MGVQSKPLARVLMMGGTSTELALANGLVFWEREAVRQGKIIEALLDRIKPTLSLQERRDLLVKLGEEFRRQEPRPSHGVPVEDL